MGPEPCSHCPLWTNNNTQEKNILLLKNLEGITRPLRFKKNQLLFTENEPCNEVIVLRKGRVKLFYQDTGGKELIVNIAGPGDILGIASFQNQKYYINGQALNDGEACGFSRQDLRSLLANYPELALCFLEHCEDLLLRSHLAVRKVGLLRAQTRLASTIFELAKSAGKLNQEGIVIEMPVTSSMLAALSGVTPETAARIIAKWKKEGVLVLKRKKLILPNLNFFQEHLKKEGFIL